jgi:uncharacterized protein (TIGR02145 family)/uncharacterized repeat protein (TIGR02543 family)
MDGNKALTAVLGKRGATRFTIHFNSNGGGEAPAPVTADSGSNIMLPDQQSMEKNGYSFEGWNTKNDGTGTNYAANASYTVKSDVTLFAIWTAQTYRLTTEVSPSGGGSVSRSPNQTSYASGTGVTVMASANAGYTFTGWSGASTSTNSSIMVTMNGDKILMANFQQSVVIMPGTGEFTDNRDGKTYKKVTIGSQTWMGENLNYQTSSGSWCYGNSADSCTKYGRLYDRSTAKTVCPVGWHLPSRVEWQTLVRAVDANAQLSGGWDDNNVAGKKLKSSSGWYNNGNGTDDYGFSALPGGFYYEGGFLNAGSYGNWWTATERGSGFAYYRYMYYGGDFVVEYGDSKSYGFSVRCLGDD